jgi:hypothetical protein
LLATALELLGGTCARRLQLFLLSLPAGLPLRGAGLAGRLELTRTGLTTPLPALAISLPIAAAGDTARGQAASAGTRRAERPTARRPAP